MKRLTHSLTYTRAAVTALLALGVIGCGGNSDNEFSAVGKSLETAIEINFSSRFGRDIRFGALVRTSEGFIVAGSIAPSRRETVILFSADGLDWEITQTIDSGRTSAPQTLGTVGGRPILIINTEGHTEGSVYHAEVYVGDLTGHFTPSFIDESYTYMLSAQITDARGCSALALIETPQIGGYKKGSVRSGWFCPDLSIEISGNLAQTGEETEVDGSANFPSETFFFRRPSDSALIAGVRFGEAPFVPWIKLKISHDEGATWSDLGVKWPGLAGEVSLCENSRGELWAAGYEKKRQYVAYTAMWKVNPETLSPERILYPFAQTGSEDVGNGQIYCDKSSPDVFAAFNDNSLKFIQVKR